MKKITVLVAALLVTVVSMAQQVFEQVNFRGAVGQNNWMQDWTSFTPQTNVYPGDPAYTGTATMVTVSTNITTNTTWTKNHWYRLTAPIIIKDGATLTIEPGTVIRDDQLGLPENNAYILVSKGSKIIANGTPEEPIVFTSGFAPGLRNPGNWGGILMVGRAQTNCFGQNSAAWGGTLPHGVRQFEALPNLQEAAYGGVAGGHVNHGTLDNNDNSGILRYVRIEFAGFFYIPNQELNSLTMAGVGSGTTIDHVQLSYGLDDGFEWFGGSVNAKYLVSLGHTDDDFDADEGYTGNIQFGVSLRDPRYFDVSNNSTNGFEFDNNTGRNGSPATGGISASNNALPLTNPVVSNMTIIGAARDSDPFFGSMGAPARLRFGSAAVHRSGNAARVYNSVFGGWRNGLELQGNNLADFSTIHKAISDTFRYRNSYFAGKASVTGADSGRALRAPQSRHSSIATFGTRAWFLTSGWNNDTVSGISAYGYTSPAYTGSFTAPNFGGINLTPLSSSVLLSSNNANAVSYSDAPIAGRLVNSATTVTTTTSLSGVYQRITINSGGNLTLSDNLFACDSIVVNAGGTLNLSTFELGSYGKLIVKSGATVRVAHPDGLFSENLRKGAVQTDRGVEISSGATVIFNGTVAQTTGDLSACGTLEINNASGVTINSASDLVVNNVVNLRSGVLTTGGKLVLNSTSASATAVIDNFSAGFTGSTSGNIKFRRFTSGAYRQVSPPVTGAVLGNNNTSCVLIRQFTESLNAWTSVPFLCGGNAFANGSSRAIFGTGDVTAEFVGAPVSGFVSFPISRGPNTPGVARGWNALGNPYPSAISWSAVASLNGGSSVTTSNMSAIIWNSSTNNYGTITAAGITTNGASNIIAPGQGFLIRDADPLTPFALDFNNTVRTLSGTSFIREGAQSLNNEIRLALKGATSTDEVLVYSSETAKDEAEFGDVEKVFAPEELGSVGFYNLAGEQLSINVIGEINTAKSLAYGIRIPANGTYSLSVNSLNLNGTRAILEDRKEGKMVVLAAGVNYEFTAEAGTDNARFFVHLNKGSQEASNFDVVAYSANGDVVVNFPSVESANAQITVLNALGQAVKSVNANGTASVRIPMDAATGIYNVVVNGVNGKAVRKVYFEGR